MKRTRLPTALIAALLLSFGAAHAAGFTYQGTLQDAGKPADGSYDLELTLYSAADHGTVIGGPLTMLKVPVQHGAFSTKVDFGPLTKTFSQAWLGIKVRSGDSGEFAAMSERSPINVDVVDTATATCPGSWGIGGNAGNPSTSYLGTSDNNPLRFEVNATQMGQITPGKGVWFGQQFCLGISCTTPSANGANSFATGQATNATGDLSFAAGLSATATQAGDFMWGDSQGGNNGGITSTTAADQFIVRSAGGAAINGTPKNSGIELSIYPSSANGGNFSNLYFGLSGQTAGILTSAGGATSSTSNDASFYFDDYNGTTQTRLFTIAPNGITVGGAATTDVSFLPQSSTASVDMLVSGTQLSNTFFIMQATSNVSPYGSQQLMQFTSDGSFFIYNTTAEKPGGGSWTTSSDRRIKQDIQPIHDALDTVMKLRPVNFHYTPEYRAKQGDLADKSYAGFIAQEYAEVFPGDVVSTHEHVPGAPDSDPTILALDPNAALINTVAAVQELAINDQASSARMSALERENAVVKQQNATLKAEKDNEVGALQRKLDSVLSRLAQLENSSKN